MDNRTTGEPDQRVRLICFYLPQFHPIPENDHWWGKGFTDWTNVARARPLFPGHYQPHLPADLGFYDLRVPEVRETQAALAQQYGIHGFCYHHYWFTGRRLLERPFNEILAFGKPNFPFCLCWANENWTRRWDGREHEVLIAQDYSEGDDRAFIQSLLPAFRDPRYICVDGKPLLIVYHTQSMPHPERTVGTWRQCAQAAGFSDLYLCRAETHTTYGHQTDPRSIGFDAAVEFPPHAILSGFLRSSDPQWLVDFDGRIFDYRQTILRSIRRAPPSYKLFRGVMPSWDNTARRGNHAFIFANSSPELYERWLADCVRWTCQHRAGEERLVFINAWNEWAEGCHLEPDARYGHRYLEATRNALHGCEEFLRQSDGASSSAASFDDSASVSPERPPLLSDLVAENILLRIQMSERAGAEPDTSSPPDPLVMHHHFTADHLLALYLQSDHARLRRLRHGLYRMLKPVWRTWQRLRGKG